MSDFKHIYLQPECCADEQVGRLWCQDPVDDCECDPPVPWTKYALVEEITKDEELFPKHLNDYNVGDLVELTKDVCENIKGERGVIYRPKNSMTNFIKFRKNMLITGHIKPVN